MKNIETPSWFGAEIWKQKSASGVTQRIFISPHQRDLDLMEDAVSEDFQSRRPGVPYLSLPQAMADNLNLVVDPEFLEQVHIHFRIRHRQPDIVDLVPLQGGGYNSHVLVVLRYPGGQTQGIVSCYGRCPTKNEIGNHTQIEAEQLIELSRLLDYYPKFSGVVDINRPLITGQRQIAGKEYSFYVTEFDPHRGEIHSVIARDPEGGDVPVLVYALRYSQAMIDVSRDQLIFSRLISLPYRDDTQEEKSRQVALKIVKAQIFQLASAFVLLAKATGYLPGEFQLNAGDMMARLDHDDNGIPRLFGAKLMSNKGGLIEITEEKEFIQRLRLYTLEPDSPVALFGQLTDSELKKLYRSIRI
jgi:hypothetical protein